MLDANIHVFMQNWLIFTECSSCKYRY